MNSLARLLLPLLKRIGRWLVKRLITRGKSWLLRRLRARVADFQGRLSRARKTRRKRWLRFRISWRERLIAWIETHSAKLTKKAAQAADAALTRAGERIPHHHPRDSWAAWDRATAG